MTNSKELKINFRLACEARGYVDSTKYILPKDPQLLFNNSGLSTFLSDPTPLESPIFFIQPCLKTSASFIYNPEAPKKDGFNIFFYQIGLIAKSSPQEIFVINKNVLDFLDEFLDTSKILAGNSKSTIKFAENIEELCHQTFNNNSSSKYLDTRSFKHKGSHAARRYYNLYYPLESGLLEIGDIGTVKIRGEKIIDCGFGLERLLAVINKTAADHFILEEVMITATKIGLDKDLLIKSVDLLRGLSLMHYLGVQPGKNGRDYMMRKLIKALFIFLDGVSTKLIYQLADQIYLLTTKEFSPNDGKKMDSENFIAALKAEIMRTRKDSVLRNTLKT